MEAEHVFADSSYSMHFALCCINQLLDLGLVARLLASHEKQIACRIDGIVDFVRNRCGQASSDRQPFIGPQRCLQTADLSHSMHLTLRCADQLLHLRLVARLLARHKPLLRNVPKNKDDTG